MLTVPYFVRFSIIETDDGKYFSDRPFFNAIEIFNQNIFSFPGHLLDDSRLDHHPGVQSSQMAIYGATGALRSGSSSSSSPGGGHGHPGAAAAAALLVVPQPINATKITAGLTNGTGTGRKYQCKMCPQVCKFFYQCTDNIMIIYVNRI